MNEQDMPQKLMTEIHRLVQKLKESGMTVDSTIGTATSLVDDTVKYTDQLTITGDFVKVRFDSRTVEEVKAEAIAQKQAVQTQRDELTAKIDEVIAIVDSKPKQVK